MKRNWTILKVLIPAFFLLVFWDARSVDLSKQNCSYWYDHLSPISVQHEVVSSADFFEVYIQVYTVQRRKDSLSFMTQNTFTSEQHLLIDPVADTLRSSVHLLILKLTLPDTTNNILLLQYQDLQPYFFPVQLKYTSVSYPSFYIKPLSEDKPRFTHFSNEGYQALRGNDQLESVYIYRYQDTFEAADPPMNTTYGLSPTLRFDSVYVASADSLFFEKGHFYFIQKDSATNVGITRYVGDEYFPKLAHMDDLIEPLLYISRKSEREEIQLNSNPKKGFDAFWLSLYPIKRNASDAIAAYYQKVTHANEMFTQYKPGWKTDRGMIYIVMGPPKEVIREDWKEIWSYGSGLSFEFRIISNLFAFQQYYLVRNETYAEEWYAAVRILRNNR